MKVDVWKALNTAFDVNKYIYHYTNIQKAIKILYSQKLIFSPLTTMNDTSEYKTRVSVDYSSVTDKSLKKDINKKLRKIIDYFNLNAKYIRLLCFSKDAQYDEIDHYDIPYWDEYERFFDLTGRGFALPRMWAQYASNNEGVCLIFDRAKLLEAIKKRTQHIIDGDVAYFDYLNRYKMKLDTLNDIYTKITQNATGVLPIAGMIQDDSDFIRYNYFVKLKDWQNEREYRILALVDNDNEFAVDGILDYLDGIVVGEKNDCTYTDIFKLLLGERNINIKKIVFDGLNCKFKE